MFMLNKISESESESESMLRGFGSILPEKILK